MASSTDICNLALLRLKTSLRIGNIDTDTSEIAQICRLLYPIVRDDFQSSRPWNFNKVTASLVESSVNPNFVWAYAYVVPPDCLFMRRIQPAVASSPGQGATIYSSALSDAGQLQAPQFDTQQSAIPFEIASGLLYTNMQSAIAEYSRRVTDEARWPSSVVVAMSYAMAAELAPSVTDGDPFNLIEKMQSLAKSKADIAAAQNANERLRIQNDSEFTRER